MNTAETFAYTEWMSKLGKLTYTLGLRMRIYNYQHDKKLSKSSFVRKLSLAYQPCSNVTLKYQGYVSAYAPSLSDMSNVSQDIDVYQLRKGNPNLKSVTFISNELSLNWGTKNGAIYRYLEGIVTILTLSWKRLILATGVC